MGNFLTAIGRGFVSSVFDSLESGKVDNISAYNTKSNRQVFKASGSNGDVKYSATRYPSGRVVETISRIEK